MPRAMDEAVAELEAEQADLETILRGLPPDGWDAPTPAEGWSVRDQVSHLADTNELAYDTATGGPRQLNEEVFAHPDPEAFTQSGVDKGRDLAPDDLLAWWRTSADRVNAMLRDKDPKERIPWGLGMAARTLVTARLMEHWAHGLDIRAGLGIPPNATPRLRSIAFLVYSALPYAFSVAKLPPPDAPLRVEIAYEGETWTFGPADAPDRIVGDALEFCRLGVQRVARAETGLKAEGSFADLALNHLRAYL